MKSAGNRSGASRRPRSLRRESKLSATATETDTDAETEGGHATATHISSMATMRS